MPVDGAIGNDACLWYRTPLLYSSHVSSLLGCSAYMKLENLQPSQSFKYRGISLFIKKALREQGHSIRLVIASSGSAGLAAACAAKVFRIKCSVYLPEGQNQRTLDTLRKAGAEIVVVGKVYSQALEKAKQEAKSNANTIIVPSYDDPTLWLGHSSMIDEIKEQLPEKPDAILCSVGGGGLIGGIVTGCESVGWDDVPIIAFEPRGSNCFYHSVSVNSGRWNEKQELPDNVETFEDSTYNVTLARLNKLTSRVTSLGATSPAAGSVKKAMERKGEIKYVCIPDEMSMHVAGLFAEDHQFLIELGCSITFTAAYHPQLFQKLIQARPKKPPVVVFIVCGSFKITLPELDEYRAMARKALCNGERNWEVLCSGERWCIPKRVDDNNDTDTEFAQ